MYRMGGFLQAIRQDDSDDETNYRPPALTRSLNQKLLWKVQLLKALIDFWSLTTALLLIYELCTFGGRATVLTELFLMLGISTAPGLRHRDSSVTYQAKYLETVKVRRTGRWVQVSGKVL